MTAKPADKATVVRFGDLRPLTKNPADTLLARYKRDRFSVVGRASERPPGAPGADAAVGINFGYLRCEPGTGNCSHHHDNWEIFIPLSGRWEMVLEGGELDGRYTLILDAWDMILIPPGAFHEATNIGDDEAWMMSLNPGAKAAGYVLHPQVIEELREHAQAHRDAARRGLDV